MVTVGSLVKFETKPGCEAEFAHFLEESLLEVQATPGTIAWFAYRLGPSTFGIFDVFTDDAGRQAHFGDGRVRADRAAALLEAYPGLQEVDVIAAKLPE